MNSNRFLVPLALAIAAITTCRASADIVQAYYDGWVSFNSVTAFGESFTATASEALVNKVSFGWEPVNDALPNPTITVRLRNGIGFSGTVLATQTVSSIPDGTPEGTWIDFLFSSPVALTPGQSYSLHFTRDNTTSASGGWLDANVTNPYPDGGYLNSSGSQSSFTDIAFRVLSMVPEPTSASLVIVGALACLATCGRRIG